MKIAIVVVRGFISRERAPDPADRGAASGAVTGFMMGLFLNGILAFHGRTSFLAVPMLDVLEQTRDLGLVLCPGSALVGALVCGLGAAWRSEAAASRARDGRIAAGHSAALRFTNHQAPNKG